MKIISDDENINLQQIIKDSGFLADDILSPPDNKYTEEPRQPKFKQRQPEYDLEPTRHQPQTKQRQPSQPSADGGVTVVSARTPSIGNFFLFKKMFNSLCSNVPGLALYNNEKQTF